VKTFIASAMRALPTDIRPVDTLWHRLYGLLGGGGYQADPSLDEQWPHELRAATLRCGYRANLNLRDWLERRAFFSGRYYQHSLELLLQSLLQPGDTWIDVGANLGLVTLAAAARIGERGKGYAFEPNPEIFKRLTEHLKLNGIRNFKRHNVALGAAPGKATLFVPKHSGQGSLVNLHDAERVEVPIIRGDDAMPLDKGPTVIKIDVEGYEMPVLRGMPRLLGHPNAAVVVEVIESLLQRAGTSTADVLALMRGHGFEPFEFAETTSRYSKSLKVTPIVGTPPNYDGDMLFLKPGSQLAKRLH
jgi:FkbM family methyltransferase